ncbi:MAG: nickel pincer cofactor biosynthesis protein LarB [Desulfovibrio sp.]|nr:nickel pincer cofactor biosynthesis protein LarB [Desulfovibrio sp.]
MHSQILFDHGRAARIGLPEAVFCEGKSFEAICELLERFGPKGERSILFTRLASDIFARVPEKISAGYDYDAVSRTAYASGLAPKKTATVAIVSAGTADAFVSHEAARTLSYLGIPFELFEDCGVAGLWRLTEKLEAINACGCVIVVAGLDAALASVLGGLTPKPIFAVPTSVGYGMACEGHAALASMLVSCAPGIGVLNIDNGYGAACAAARVVLQLAEQRAVAL